MCFGIKELTIQIRESQRTFEQDQVISQYIFYFCRGRGGRDMKTMFAIRLFPETILPVIDAGMMRDI